MRITKTSLAVIAVAGLLSFGTAAQAQTNRPPGGAVGGAGGGGAGRRGGVDQQMARLSEQLNLTDAQKPKVKAVLEEQSKEMQELRNITDQTERRSKLMALREETNKKLKAILTPEQFKKYEEIQPRGGRRNGGGGGGGAGAGGQANPGGGNQ